MNLSRRPSDRLGPPQGERMDPGEKSSFPSLPPVPGTPVSSVAAGCPSAVVKSFAPVAGCSVREADGSIRCAGEGEKAFIHTANKPTGGGQGLKVKGQERVGRVCGFTGLPRRTKKAAPRPWPPVPGARVSIDRLWLPFGSRESFDPVASCSVRGATAEYVRRPEGCQVSCPHCPQTHRDGSRESADA